MLIRRPFRRILPPLVLGTAVLGCESIFSAGDPTLRFTAVSAGGEHTCAISDDGTTYCWGAGENGQLGHGRSSGSFQPVAVAGGLAFTVIAAGGSHTCALDVSGQAFCWGDNGSGQTGTDPATGVLNEPHSVSGALRFTYISAGQAHTCGIAEDGTAYCWGQNTHGQLGDGTTTDRSTPTAVLGFRFVQLDAGAGHTCAVAGNGIGYCWGLNDFGQLGNGTRVNAPAPQRLTGRRRFLQVSAGATHSCGIVRRVDAVCWGSNLFGELGNTAYDIGAARPVAVYGRRGFSAVDVGAHYGCGIVDQTWCWGRGEYGQIGIGRISNESTAQPITDVSFEAVSAGGTHTCGVAVGNREGGLVYCWGKGDAGQLGNLGTTFTMLPVRVQSR